MMLDHSNLEGSGVTVHADLFRAKTIMICDVDEHLENLPGLGCAVLYEDQLCSVPEENRLETWQSRSCYGKHMSAQHCPASHERAEELIHTYV